MVKEIDLEAGTRLRLKEIQSIELIPREGEQSALHYIDVNGVRFHIHHHISGTVSLAIHGMKKHGERVGDKLTFDEITICSPKGKVSKQTKTRKDVDSRTFKTSTLTWTDIKIN